VEQLCKSIGVAIDRGQAEDVLLACKREMVVSGIDFRKPYETNFDSDEAAYGCILALTELATAMDRVGEVSHAADCFRGTLLLTRQINEEHMRAWSYARILERCGDFSPVRPQAEMDAIEMLRAIGTMSSQSIIAEAWLKTTRIPDRETARQMFLYLRHEKSGWSNLVETFPAILRRQGLGSGASLILEAAATFSPEDVLYAAALVAHEASTQNGRIDRRLVVFLEEAPASFGL
jgi:hypothetical protein